MWNISFSIQDCVVIHIRSFAILKQIDSNSAKVDAYLIKQFTKFINTVSLIYISFFAPRFEISLHHVEVWILR